jgi:hypothetical protein
VKRTCMCVVAACALGVQAAVSLPDLFGDHALLQRDAATAAATPATPPPMTTTSASPATGISRDCSVTVLTDSMKAPP